MPALTLPGITFAAELPAGLRRMAGSTSRFGRKPELWGYVVFANNEGAAGFEIPEDEYIKWELRQLYYRQRNHFAETGAFAAGLSMLAGLDGLVELDGLAGLDSGFLEEVRRIGPRIETTARMFQISAPSADGTGTFYIREDGKLWRE